MTHLNQQTERGFTLVELAIVLIIVGLLIGGILKGQELIQNARVTSTVSQVKGFEAASNTFRDSFGTVPGDLEGADDRLANCGGTCDAGDNNGRINQNPGDEPAGESLAAFSQLAAADLISGANATPIDDVVNIGDELPAADVGGSGFVMGYAAGTLTGSSAGGNVDVSPGTYVVLNGDVTSQLGADEGIWPLTPLDAIKMDNKLDDGLPNSGSVRAGGESCAASNAANAQYEDGSALDCTVFMRIM